MKIALVIERMEPQRGGREISTGQLAAELAGSASHSSDLSQLVRDSTGVRRWSLLLAAELLSPWSLLLARELVSHSRDAGCLAALWSARAAVASEFVSHSSHYNHSSGHGSAGRARWLELAAAADSRLSEKRCGE